MVNIKNKNIQTYINLGSSLITMFFSLLVSFFLSPYIVSTLGAEANGFTQLANNFITYASLITLALNSMAGRFISIAYHKNEFDKANKYYTSTIIGNMVISLALVLPAILCVYNLENIINIDNSILEVKILFTFCFINFFIGQLFSVFGVATFVTNKLYIRNIIDSLKTMLNAILLLLLFMLFEPRMYFVSMVGVVLTVLSTIALVRVKSLLLKELQFSIKDFNLKYVKELVMSGIWNAVNQGGNILMTGMDLLLTNLFIDPIQMGILSVAKSMPYHIISLGSTVNSNFTPNLTIAFAQNDKSDMLRQLRSAMKISSIFLSIPIMTFCVYGQVFYQLWMPSLDARVLLILSFLTCLAYIPASGTQALYNVFTVTNKLKFNSILFLINGFINVIIVYILLKHTDLGVFAVAGVSSVTTIIRIMTFILPYTAKLLNLKWYTFYNDVGISMLCAFICFIIAVITYYVLLPNNWIMLIVSVGITCILSLLAQMYFLLNKGEREYLLNKILRRKNHG